MFSALQHAGTLHVTGLDGSGCEKSTVAVLFKALVPQKVLFENACPSGDDCPTSYSLAATFGASYCGEDEAPILVIDGVMIEKVERSP